MIKIQIKYFKSDFMVKPIAKTPVFESVDVIAVLKEMQETPTQEDKEFAKEIRELFYSQDNIFCKLYFLNLLFYNLPYV